MSDDTDGPGSGATPDRRGFLRGLAAAAGTGLAARLADRDILRPVRAAEPTSTTEPDPQGDTDRTFPQSVMSGGPTTSGVILWTRIAPEAHDPDADVVVQVAADPGFAYRVLERSVPGTAVGPEGDHCLKVDLDGELESNTEYHYRFLHRGTASPVGRCRTLPAAGEADEVSLALMACQDYQNGYYGAYSRVARADVDFIVHLGDFVYESADGAFIAPEKGVREGRDFDLPSGASRAETLADFRTLYRTYKSDPLLQQGLEAHTLIAGWDDHEIANNRYWDYAAEAPGLPGRGGDREFALDLTANGIQAWVEHMPARVEYDPEAETLHDQFRLWRTVEFGDLLELVVTDERLFRDPPPCRDGDVLTCFSEDDPDRTMLGARQREWWKSRMRESTATWTAWLNEVLSMPLTVGTGWGQVEFVHDSWDGYQAERYELMQALRGVDNAVALTGDLHCSMAGYMEASYGEFGGDSDERVGVELMTPAVSSINAANVIDLPSSWDEEGLNDVALNQNPHLQYVDWYRNGYSLVRFDGEECRFTAYAVDSETDAADAEQAKLAEFVVPEGEVSLREQYNRFEENAGSDIV